MNPWVGGGLAAAALAAGWAGAGWRGLVLALSVVVFWLLLQFGRAMRAMRRAAGAPLGHVQSAVMLHARMRAGLTMLDLVVMTGSLGEPASGERPASAYRWRDPGGTALCVSLRNGRVAAWQLERADEG